MSRFWNDDFETRLQHIREEEADVLARMNRRSRAQWRISEQIIVFSLVLEVIAIAYGMSIATTRSKDLNWKMRVFGVLPMLLLPALSFSVLSWVRKLSQICYQRDEETMERLHAEIHAKLDERKEEMNHYLTQQHIQIRQHQMLLDLLSFRTEPGEEIDLHEDFNTEAEIDLYEHFNTEAERKDDTKVRILDRYHLVVRPLPCYVLLLDFGHK